jgi:transcriptional regulator with XRE-family HTH domain
MRGIGFNPTVPLRDAVARRLRETRLALDVSQREVAAVVGVSRGYVAHLEDGSANPSLDVVERLGSALGIEFELTARTPLADPSPRQRDVVHAWCSGYVDRRLRRAGWVTKREVEIVHGRHHGWIDLVAFEPVTSSMLVVEIKTRLDDVGGVERQMSWYERSAMPLAHRVGWRPARVSAWLLLLASDEVEGALRTNRAVIATGFPARASILRASIDRVSSMPSGRGLALIDPSRRGRAWLLPSRLDGRRSPAAFVDYADAAKRLRR